MDSRKFETAMVNEPSVFEPLKFYCSIKSKHNSVLAVWHDVTAHIKVYIDHCLVRYFFSGQLQCMSTLLFN